MAKQELQIALSEGDARLIIEALKQLEAKWEHIAETSLDEDERAEYGNDLMSLYETTERVTKAAASIFGTAISSFDRTPL